MTPDEIIEMAREAGLHLYVNDIIEKPYAEIVVAFANLVAAKERESLIQPEEHNFCPRCGKRNKDIHTCTPPQD